MSTTTHTSGPAPTAAAASSGVDPIPGAAGGGCDACRVVGPLLTGPGTSGRSWRCGCGQVWAHQGGGR